MKRKIYCTNVHLRIIEILITSVYNSVLSLLPLHVGSEYKIVTSVTEKKMKTASQNQRLSFGEVHPARGNRATWVRKQAPSLTAGVQQTVDRRRWERSFGSRRQQVGNPEIPSSRLQFCCQYLRQVGTADGNANALGKCFCKAWANWAKGSADELGDAAEQCRRKRRCNQLCRRFAAAPSSQRRAQSLRQRCHEVAMFNMLLTPERRPANSSLRMLLHKG